MNKLKCAKFNKNCVSGKKLNSISRARLDFRRLPILCTTLYKPYASEQLRSLIRPTFLLKFLWSFHRRCLSTSSVPWFKKVENDHKLKSRGSCLNCAIACLSNESHSNGWMTSECVCTGSILPRGTGRKCSQCIDVNSRFPCFPLSDFTPSGLASSMFIFASILSRSFLFSSSMQGPS